MSNYQDGPGDGALFPVREKRNEKGPDFTGYFILPDGKRIQLAAWNRNRGVVSLKRDERAEQRQAEKQGERPVMDHRDDPVDDGFEDSDLPF